MSAFFDPTALKPDFVAFRRAAFFGAIAATTGAGLWLLWRMLEPQGLTPLEVVQLVLFVLLFQQIAAGFWLVVFGFLLTLRGGDRATISRSIPPGLPGPFDPAVRTAIALPVFNEDVGRVFAAVEAMWRGLKAAGGTDGFDFFILSDSNRPESWIAEEEAWRDLCRREDAFGRIFYRKRRVPRNSKSGNVADFCRRWGASYRYMIVLDADSIMTGALLRRLVAMMEKNPRVGLIQTAPQLVFGRTLFRRIQQFAARLYAPLFAAGANFWHLFGGNYWGHNAIIRLRPFMESCDLPDLPEPEAQRRHIFSHDTVEAALMRRAGYDVWFACAEEGSYEEGPPGLSESLARDRRWSLGNLQHFWFLFAPRIDFANRFHIWMGVMAYLSSPLWLLFLLAGTVDLALKNRFSLWGPLPETSFTVLGGLPVLFLATLAILFLPKVLALLAALPRARDFGGVLRLVVSTLLETVLWTFLAPGIMIYYTQFVVMNLAGLRIQWAAQNRSDEAGLGFLASWRIFWLAPAVGVLFSVGVWLYAPSILAWLSPILAGWLLTPILAWWTSSPHWGDAARHAGLFLIPEEQPDRQPAELAAVGAWSPGPARGPEGFVRAVIDPAVHRLHGQLLRDKPPPPPAVAAYRRNLCQRALDEGPGGLRPREVLALLWDRDALAWLHREVWSRPSAALPDFWRVRLEDFLSPGRRA
jgi:membrane glycosyltransferase